jgi:hypothetical protein
MKYFLILICLLPFFSVTAQDSARFCFSAGAGYDFQRSDDVPSSAYYTNDSWDKTQNLNFRLSASRKLTCYFSAGVSFLYNIALSENFEKKTPLNASTGYTGLITSFAAEMKEKTYSPQLFLRYDYPVSERITLSADFYTGFDFHYSKYTSSFNQGLYILPRGYYYGSNFDSIYGNIFIQDTTRLFFNPQITDAQNNSKQDTRSIRLGIKPSLRFGLFKNAGIEFSFGVMEFRKKLFDSRMPDKTKLSHGFRSSFGPETWLIGFYMAI